MFLGSLLGEVSPVATATPLLGAELLLDAGTGLTLDVDETFEHGLLVDTGGVSVAGVDVARSELGYVAPGRAQLELHATEPTRLLVLGGPPFGEPIMMWWNFVGRTHEEIVAFRAEWQEQISRDGAVVRDSQDVAAGRFGVVLDDHLPPIPAPEMPQVRLRPRG